MRRHETVNLCCVSLCTFAWEFPQTVSTGMMLCDAFNTLTHTHQIHITTLECSKINDGCHGNTVVGVVVLRGNHAPHQNNTHSLHLYQLDSKFRANTQCRGMENNRHKTHPWHTIFRMNDSRSSFAIRVRLKERWECCPPVLRYRLMGSLAKILANSRFHRAS